jgi:hypothetical protein
LHNAAAEFRMDRELKARTDEINSLRSYLFPMRPIDTIELDSNENSFELSSHSSSNCVARFQRPVRPAAEHRPRAPDQHIQLFTFCAGTNAEA